MPSPDDPKRQWLTLGAFAWAMALGFALWYLVPSRWYVQPTHIQLDKTYTPSY